MVKKTKAPKQNKPKKPKMGRPTKFLKSYCADIVKFFSVEAYKNIATDTMKEYFRDGTLKKEATRGKLVPNPMPTLFRFAESIKVDVGTLNDWAGKFPDFSRAFTRAKELQKEYLMNLALAGISPPSAFIFIASNVTDMRTRGASPDELDPAAFLVPVIIQRGFTRAEIPAPKPVASKDITLKTLPETHEKTTAGRE